MINITFYNLNEIDESLLKRVVIVSNYQGKWIYCKHKERDTWEIPGGHIEEGENPLDAAKRELYEETGATKYTIEPICTYLVNSHALLCYAEIEELAPLPGFEIGTIAFFENEPDNLTYPEMHKSLFAKIQEIKNLKKNKSLI